MSRRIMYLRLPNGHPVGCVAISLDKKSSSVQYQVSVLNPQDKFNRAVARQLAIGRLVESPISVRVEKDANMHDISFAVMDHLAYYGRGLVPSRAVRSARMWLSRNVID